MNSGSLHKSQRAHCLFDPWFAAVPSTEEERNEQETSNTWITQTQDIAAQQLNLANYAGGNTGNV
jgi:hypothetical protein